MSVSAINGLNALVKTEASVIKLTGENPSNTTLISGYGGLVSAALNAASAAYNSPLISNASLLVNSFNFSAQLAVLNEAINSGDAEKIATAALNMGASVAGLVGSIPSPIQAQARAISAGLSLGALAVGNRAALTNALSDAFDNWDTNLSWKDIFPGNSPRGIDPSTSNFWRRFMKWVQLRDPLVLDLDNDGIETIAASVEDPVLFDIDADGVKNGTGWIKPDDGFLVLDRN